MRAKGGGEEEVLEGSREESGGRFSMFSRLEVLPSLERE